MSQAGRKAATAQGATNWKRSAWLTWVLIVLLSLAACSTGAQESDSEEPEAEPADTQETDAADEADPSEMDEETEAPMEARTFSFAYDQPHETAFGITADIFGDALEEASGGAFTIEQFPDAQLGAEADMLQDLLSGDIDFVISSTPNAATVAEQSAVLALHYLFEDEEHYLKALTDPEVFALFSEMFDESVDGARAVALHTLGFRNLYTVDTEVRTIDDVAGLSVRVQATDTEDTLWGAYGANTVHMAFGEVYTSLQTGVINGAENGINVYQANQHFEAAPILNLTEHMANTAMIAMSDEAWNSLSDEEKGWIEAARDAVHADQPPAALALEKKSSDEIEGQGVTVVEVDKSGFIAAASPLVDEIAAQLGDHAVQIVARVRELK